MNTRVINDPSSLGWEYDPDTDRWTWGGGSSAGGGDGTFPEAPVNGKQYGRQDAGWTEIVHTDGGGDGYDDTEIKADLAQETQDRIDGDANLQGQIDNLSGNPVTTADVALVTPTRLPSGLENQQDANAYIAESLDKLIDQDGNVIAGGIEEAPQDSVIYGRRNKDWVVVPTGGGGDGSVDLSAYYTAAQCDSKFEPKFIKNTAFNKNFGTTSTTVAQGNHTHSNYAGKNHDHAGVYQPAGSYATLAGNNSFTGSNTFSQNLTANNFVLGGSSGSLVVESSSVDSRLVLIAANSTLYGGGSNDYIQVSASGVITASKITAKGGNSDQWNTAHSWGNHSTQGYLKTESDPTVPPHVKSIKQTDIDKWNNPPSGGNDYDGSDAVKLTGDQTVAGRKTFADRVTTNTGLVVGGNTDCAGWIKAGLDITAGGNISASGTVTAATNVYAHQFIVDASKARALIGYSSGGVLEVAKAGEAILKGGGGVFKVSAGSAALTGSLTATGTITGTDCIATSDERLKKNVEPVRAGVITQLEGVDFQWIQNEAKSSGFIAQQVQQIPELSHLVHQTDEQGHLGVSYMGMIPYLLAEIKSLKSRLEELESA